MPLALPACAGRNPVDSLIDNRRGKADAVAGPAGFQARTLRAGDFFLASWQRITRPGARRLTVYLETDGLTHLLNSAQISRDPTPTDPMVLRMAVQHPGANVAYLARPCQYVDRQDNLTCSLDSNGFLYWTAWRYHEKAVAAMNRAVDDLKRQAGATELVLIGASGGGVIAALLAARRGDVAGFVTVASPLDHVRWRQLQGFIPFDDCPNPADQAEALRAIPQAHFAGGRDELVPMGALTSYLDRLGRTDKVTVKTVAGYGHQCCWDQDWPALLRAHAGFAVESAGGA